MIDGETGDEPPDSWWCEKFKGGIFQFMDSNSIGAFPGTRSGEAVKKLAILFSAVLLGACGDTQTAFVSDGDRDHSLSVIRVQAYLRGPWQTTLIVAGLPQCQRRYPIGELAAGEFRVDVHRPAPGVFILEAGKRWYVAELQNCGFQAYKSPPPEPGERVGSFEMKDGALRYSAKMPARTAATGSSRAGTAAR